MTPFKDLFTKKTIISFAKRLELQDSKFDSKKIISDSGGLDRLELKDSIEFIATLLSKHLPYDFQQNAKILVSILGGEVTGFWVWPLTTYIEHNGQKDLKTSFWALEEMTSFFTSEFAIRSFLINHPTQTMRQMLKWSKSPNHHLRRLSSEGTRPSLPWGKKIISFHADPTQTLPILKNLIHDPELYVRKSVANHLNDIAKINPPIVFNFLKEFDQNQPHIKWVTKHALRTLIKAGNKTALKMIGINAKVNFDYQFIKINKKNIKMNEVLSFTFEIKTSKKVPLIIDYVIYHQKNNGTLSPKVFKYKTMTLDSKMQLTLNHKFKPITTRKYYQGEHQIALKINGNEQKAVTFILDV
jgi:3-methyladenine DNA glycosylase AlkC